MRLTATMLDAETTIRALLAEVRTWTIWHDDSDKRTRHTPTLVAIHTPTRTVLAVYVRPRRLHPSEHPDTSWLPAGITAVVWHSTIKADVRRWLRSPAGDPPGLVDDGRS